MDSIGRLSLTGKMQDIGVILTVFTILSNSCVQCIMTNSENEPFESDLHVVLSPSALMHKRSTRASSSMTSGSGGRWIPAVHPKFRKPFDGRYYNQRAIMPMHSQPHPYVTNLRQMPPYLPPPRLQLTRPSQPEPQHSGSQLYAPPPASSLAPPSTSENPGPSEGYLPAEQFPPNPGSDDLANNPGDSELRFLFHRPEDENLIKSTILEESERYNERVSFVRGPTLKFQRRQTIYLPPRKKSVIYIMLKEPQVQTDLEVIEPQVDDTPEVNIVYEKGGGVITKHYYSTSDKLLQNGVSGGSGGGSGGASSGTISLTEYPTSQHEGYPSRDLTASGSEVKSLRVMEGGSDPKKRATEKQTLFNSCQPIFKKLRKR